MWYDDWQDKRHAELFDSRARLTSGRLAKSYQSFNDVRLLNERLDRKRRVTLLEIGCATGEFYRYLRTVYPRLEYVGCDISEPAVARAREKFPEGRFFRCAPDHDVPELLSASQLTRAPEIVYTKDVLHHQTDPFGFLRRLLRVPSESLILRTRTRDVGPTVLDPEESCQRHYNGWMPYLVLNLEELLECIRAEAPESELCVYRNRMVLGGREGRLLPKECYLPETGTAETAIGVFLKTDQPGETHLEDRPDMEMPETALDRWKGLLVRGCGRCKPG